MLRDGSEVTRLLLVRHAQPQAIPDDVPPAAWLDSDLTETGEKQAKLVADALRDEAIDVLVCSSMRRAIQTAEQVGKITGVTPQVEPDLSEVDVYGGLPPDAWPAELLGGARWADAQERFVRERKWGVFGLGETGEQLRERVARAIDQYVLRHPDKVVAVVCHGGVINAYLARVLNLEPDMFFYPAHASVSRVLVSTDDRHVLEGLNERHHVQSAGLLTY